jgi:hypothetical protein
MTHPVSEHPHLMQTADQPGVQIHAVQRLDPLVQRSAAPAQPLQHQMLHQPTTMQAKSDRRGGSGSQQLDQFIHINLNAQLRVMRAKTPQHSLQLLHRRVGGVQVNLVALTALAAQLDIDPTCQLFQSRALTVEHDQPLKILDMAKARPAPLQETRNRRSGATPLLSVGNGVAHPSRLPSPGCCAFASSMIG